MLAVRVAGALRLTPRDGIRIGDKAGLTATNGIAAAGDRALGARAAGRRVTGIRPWDTALALTDVIAALEAVRIAYTLRATAGDGVRLGNEAGLTLTDGIAGPVHRAPRARTAGVRVTGVGLLLALVSPAHKAHTTVGIHAAFRLAGGDGIRIGRMAADAATLGIPVPVQRAGCARTAGCWTAGVAARTGSPH